MTGEHAYADTLTVTLVTRSRSHVSMGVETATGYWEYPVVTPPTEPMASDGPVGAVTVAADQVVPSTCGAMSCSLIEIAGVFPSTGTVQVLSNTSSSPTQLGSVSLRSAIPSTIEVPGSVPSLEATGFQIAWGGGYDYGLDGFPTEYFPFWPTNRIVNYNSMTGTWS